MPTRLKHCRDVIIQRCCPGDSCYLRVLYIVLYRRCSLPYPPRALFLSQMVYSTGPVLLLLGLSGAMGQVFIFVTISKFGALTCSIIGDNNLLAFHSSSFFFHVVLVCQVLMLEPCLRKSYFGREKVRRRPKNSDLIGRDFDKNDDDNDHDLVDRSLPFSTAHFRSKNSMWLHAVIVSLCVRAHAHTCVGVYVLR